VIIPLSTSHNPFDVWVKYPYGVVAELVEVPTDLGPIDNGDQYVINQARKFIYKAKQFLPENDI